MTRRLLVLLLMMVGVAHSAAAAERSPREAMRPERPAADHYRILLETPEPILSPESDGSVAVKVDGFETAERNEGAPDIPTKTLLVAIPPGAQPRLEIVNTSDPRAIPARPRPVARWAADLTADEQYELSQPELSPDRRLEILRGSMRPLREPSAEFFGRSSRWPRDLAWLGATGAIRDQRYVEVHLAPVRYDGASRGLHVTDRLEVIVHFEGGAAVPLGALAPTVDRFEDVYRRNIVNYEQGRTFRLSASPEGISDGRSVARGSAASSTLTSGAPLYKLRVLQNGVVRLDHTLLQSAGFTAEPIARWRLRNRGVEVALHTNDDGDGLLEPGEWVQFYGQALDDEPKAVLNAVVPGPDIYEARDFTDENVYFLDVAPVNQPAMPTLDATPTLTRTPPTSFEEVDHQEVDHPNGYRPLGGEDAWYWWPAIFAPGTREITMPLIGLASGTLPAEVTVKMRGVSGNENVDPDHEIVVRLQNNVLQTLATDISFFDDRTIHTVVMPWTWPGAGAELTTGSRVQIEAVPVVGSTNDVILDWVEVRYQRLFSAVSDRLTFSWPDEDAEFVVSGLTSAAPVIYEITGRIGQTGVVSAVRLTGAQITGGGPYTARFRIDNDPQVIDGTPRRFVVAGAAASVVPAGADFTADTVSDLRDNDIQADLIVIAHPAVIDACHQTSNCPPSDALQALLDHRATPQGGGLSSKLALIGDVYDEFQHGLPGPTAIREFLRWVMSTEVGEGWADPKPAYVLLIGDASIDYKAGTSNGTFVPTQVMYKDAIELGYYASDSVMAAVVGNDAMPDLAVGRISSRSIAETTTMLDKILDHELAPAGGDWRHHVVFVSDRGKTLNNPAEALQFEMLNDQAKAHMPLPPYTARSLRYWSDYYASCHNNPGGLNCCNLISTDTNPNCPWNRIREDIKEAVNGTDGFSDGAALVQFLGHGGFTVWSDDAFFDVRTPGPYDSDDLINGTQLPWLLAHNCLTGGFHLVPFDTLGERWMKRSGGGAVAAFSPSGLAFNFISTTVIDVIWDDLFGPFKVRRVGEPVLNTQVALCAQGSLENCQHYVLLGDPALNLALQSVAPPTDVEAVGGNSQVALSWTASATAGATYDVYRRCFPPDTDNCNAGYAKINGSPIPTASYVDTTAKNTVVYYYYVIARDGEGFESRWSNFNTDCGIDGPDCVKAEPLNTIPPSAPTGVALADPGTGQLVVSWNPNPEIDIDYYTIHYGTSSGNYTSTYWGGRSTSSSVSGLVDGEVYYVVVRATNTSGLTSAPSAEVSDYPVLAPGLRPPDFIDDLRLGAAGADIVLQWTPVTTDVFGKPLTVTGYEIYRGSAPSFTSSGITLIDTCASPCSSYIDPGARTAGGDLKYFVRALDSNGNRSGLGADLPAQNFSLRVGPSATPGNIVLTWDPTASSIDGRPLQLLHYVIYTSGQPFSRLDVRDGVVPPLTTTGSTTFELTPPAGDRYYSVLAVDIRGNVSPF